MVVLDGAMKIPHINLEPHKQLPPASPRVVMKIKAAPLDDATVELARAFMRDIADDVMETSGYWRRRASWERRRGYGRPRVALPLRRRRAWNYDPELRALTPDVNLYGCTPCPRCGGVHRCVFMRDRGRVYCDDCDYRERVRVRRYEL